jgi:hypothetical protein
MEIAGFDSSRNRNAPAAREGRPRKRLSRRSPTLSPDSIDILRGERYNGDDPNLLDPRLDLSQLPAARANRFQVPGAPDRGSSRSLEAIHMAESSEWLWRGGTPQA